MESRRKGLFLILPYIVVIIVISCVSTATVTKEASAASNSQVQARRVWIPTKQNDSVYLYGDKRALVIGVGNYTYLPRLLYAVRDAEEVTEALTQLGFQVQMLKNPTSSELRETLRGLPYTDIGKDNALLILPVMDSPRNWLTDPN